MEEADDQLGFSSGSAAPPPPFLVSLSPFSPIPPPSARRLSSHFTPSRPVPSVRKLAWVSLQGRIVNLEEASSAKAIGGGLSKEQIVAWQLFSPIQRFLIVSLIGVAVAESKKNRLISQLKKSVELRDQVLSRMQQKLDDLCEQVNSIKSHSGAEANTLSNNNVESLPSDAFDCDRIKFADCGCWHCDYHQNLFAGVMQGNSAVKLSRGDEVLQYKMPLVNEVEQEERRMSDLSDWASSVTSSMDMQMNISSIDQDIFNLKRESEEKAATTIKELTNILRSTNMAGSKRVAELEDIIRRKNTVITKLKKDTIVLEQKLVHFTRLRRPSSSHSISDSWESPHVYDNIVYDMDSTTSPSSSASDSSPLNKPEAPVTKNQVTPIQESPLQINELASTTKWKSVCAKASSSLLKITEQRIKSRSASPLKEISTNEKSSRLLSLRPKQLSANGEIKKIRRRIQTASSDAAPKKRWM